MQKHFLFYYLIFLYACKSAHCPGYEKNIAEFKKNLNIVKSAEESNADIFVDDYRNALLFLSNITGVVTKAEYSSTIGYKSKKEYKKDIKTWENWLSQNKCKLSTRYIDSAMSRGER